MNDSFRPLAGNKSHKSDLYGLTLDELTGRSFRPLAGNKSHKFNVIRLEALKMEIFCCFRPLAGNKSHKCYGQSINDVLSKSIIKFVTSKLSMSTFYTK